MELPVFTLMSFADQMILYGTILLIGAQLSFRD